MSENENWNDDESQSDSTELATTTEPPVVVPETNPQVFPGPPKTVQTLQTRYLCPCGSPAVMTFAFPGEPKQGRCAVHEEGTILRKEPEPGRTYVASIERYPAVQTSRVD